MAPTAPQHCFFSVFRHITTIHYNNFYFSLQSAIEAKSSSSNILQETVNVTTGRGAAKVAALGPSTSNGGCPPKFRFTELRPISSVQSVNSVHRQFVFSQPEPPAGQFAPIKTVPSDTVSAAPAPTTLCQTSSFATPSGSNCSSGGRINNGHSQLSAGNSSSFSSLENFSSSSCVGSNTNFSLGTNGGGGVHSPLLNFKSAAMPDVTNSAKLSKGVDFVQGKQPFNKLFYFFCTSLGPVFILAP